MWLPDEFDFLMELVELQGNCECGDPLSNPDKLLIRKECQELWSNLCLYQDPHSLSIVKLKEYIATLLWKAARFSWKRRSTEKFALGCASTETRTMQVITPTKVGVKIKVSLYGKGYKKTGNWH